MILFVSPHLFSFISLLILLP